MNTTWNLDVIYKGFADPVYAGDLQALEKNLQAFDAFSQTISQSMDAAAALREAVALQEKIAVLADKLATYANLRQAANTKDQEAGSQMGRILALYSTLAAPQAAFEGQVSISPTAAWPRTAVPTAQNSSLLRATGP